MQRQYMVRLGHEKLLSKHSYRERGMELSDLVQFDRDLWTVCDSTGLLYRLRDVGDEERRPAVLPQRVLLDGDGNSSMPCKSEWMAVKDGALYVGGHGKEWVDAGVVRGRGAEWVRVLSPDGSLRYEDWHDRYAKLRVATNPRFQDILVTRVSIGTRSDALDHGPQKAQTASVEGGYDDGTDETRGTNLLLSVSEDFSTINTSTIELDVAWGRLGFGWCRPQSCSTTGLIHVTSLIRSSEHGDQSRSSVGALRWRSVLTEHWC